VEGFLAVEVEHGAGKVPLVVPLGAGEIWSKLIEICMTQLVELEIKELA